VHAIESARRTTTNYRQMHLTPHTTMQGQRRSSQNKQNTIKSLFLYRILRTIPFSSGCGYSITLPEGRAWSFDFIHRGLHHLERPPQSVYGMPSFKNVTSTTTITVINLCPRPSIGSNKCLFSSDRSNECTGATFWSAIGSLKVNSSKRVSQNINLYMVDSDSVTTLWELASHTRL
jgi:hypothetical protein